jgi:SAM-dependent methyltransferase
VASVSTDSHYEYRSVFYDLFDRDEQFIIELLRGQCPGKRILDYGCGEGAWARRLSALGAEAYGIDARAGSIERARRLAAQRDCHANFEVMDAHTTRFPNAFFDFIVVSGVLQYLDTDRAFAELRRILRPDGQVIALEGLRHNLVISTFRRLTPGARSTWGPQRILGRSDIYRARRYFDSVRLLRFFHFFDLASLPLRTSRLFAPVRHTLESLDHRLLKLPGIRWQAWTLVFSLSGPKHQRSEDTFAI